MKNKQNGEQLGMLNTIHTYLGKTKIRAIVLFPPLTLCIIGAIVAAAHIFSNYSFVIPSFVQWTYIGSVIWLILGVCLIVWSDIRREKI